MLESRYRLLRLRPQSGRFAGCEIHSKSLEVRDLADGSLLRTLTNPADVSSLTWRSDGRFLAAGCEDGRIVIWDAANGEKHAELRGHQEAVVSVGFSHSGGLLGSSSWDEQFQLWDLAAGSPLLGAAGWSYQVSFSPDDHRIGYVQRGNLAGSLEFTPSSISHRLNCKRSLNRGFTTDEAGGLTHAMMRAKGVFSHVEPPGAIDSIALCINELGQVAGWYDDALGITHGFLYHRGVFTTIDVPGSPGSEVTSIDNDGLITGDYVGADGADHGFIGTTED